MIAVNSSMPNEPRLLMVNPAPSYSAGARRPARARTTRSASSLSMARSVFAPQSRTIGATRPSSSATASAMSAAPCSVIVSPFQVAFTRGCRRSASAASFIRKAFSETLRAAGPPGAEAAGASAASAAFSCAADPQQAFGVHRHGEIVVRSRRHRLGEPPGDGAAHGRHGNDAVARGGHGPGRGPGSKRPARPRAERPRRPRCRASRSCRRGRSPARSRCRCRARSRAAGRWGTSGPGRLARREPRGSG